MTLRISVPLILAVSIAITAARPAPAAGPDALDAQTKSDIQSVITRQLDALAHDDGKAAEDFAAPGIRTKFPEPSKFLDMVKSSYAALIRPRSTQFNELSSSPHGPLQKVTIVAADGMVWTAVYSFEIVDGQWRITGCGLQKDESQQAI